MCTIVRERDWVQTANLIGEDSAAFDYLGWSVAIEGDVIAGGASWANETGIKSGRRIHFPQNKNMATGKHSLFQVTCLLKQILVMPSISIGERLIVGAPYVDELVNAHGGAYIFRDDNGSWVQEARMVPGILM